MSSPFIGASALDAPPDAGSHRPDAVRLSPLVDLTPDQRALFAFFDRLRIGHVTYDHPPVFTVAESDYLQALIPGTHCRSLLLANKTGGLWLVSAADTTRIDLKHLSDALATPRFSFAKAERMTDILRVTPGSLTPLAVLFDTQNIVQVILDAALMAQERCVFHPLCNTRSTVLATGDLVRFLKSTGHAPRVMALAPGGDAPDPPL